MKKMIRKLPDSELEVMQAVWSYSPPVSRKAMEDHLKNIHPMAQTTLLTLLTRLAEKEFIRIEKNGRSSCYYPLISEQEYLAEQSNRFFNKLCSGNISTFANALCDSGLTKEELAMLRDLLERGAL